jgi:hypothetical protein
LSPTTIRALSSHRSSTSTQLSASRRDS